jgi:hypothetical protein
MFFCKSIIPWELLCIVVQEIVVQEYESTGLTNTGITVGPTGSDQLHATR